MKLQKHKTRKDKNYYKYVAVIPKEAIKKAGLKEGDELVIEARKGELRLRKGKI
jgi:bifunctional DNA-binding transcriptional regulator/antitoxin component of YhaV-PrlF toxin-antitoxin module